VAPNSGWSAVSSLDSNTNADGRLEVLALNNDQTMQHNHQASPNSGWVTWATLPGTTFLRYE
jgi:hypothetical protein